MTKEDRVLEKVAVIATDGKTYYGVASFKYHEGKRMYPGGAMGLQDVWEILVIDTQIMDRQTGNSVLSRKVMAMPVGCALGPLKNMTVKASAWYFPQDEPKLAEQFDKLIAMAEAAVTDERMQAAGLVAGQQRPPGGLPSLRQVLETKKG